MNKEHKSLVIIIYLIMIVIAIGGPIIAINEKESLEEIETEKYHDTEKDNDYEKTETEKEEQEEEYKDDEDYTTSLDLYLDKYTFTVTKTDREKLIKSTSLRNCMSNDIYGTMFNENVSNDFKLYYTLDQLVRFIGEESGIDAIAGKVTIKKETLLENARKIFSEVEIPSNINNEISYFGTYKLSCTNELCTFYQDTFGVTGITPIDGYETKIIEIGNTYQVKVIYVDEEMINYDTETDIYTFNAKLYNKHNGTLLKTINNYELDLSQEINVYDEFSPYYEEIDEYTYTFDEDNRLLNITKSR